MTEPDHNEDGFIFEHEDEETFQLRIVYQQALQQAVPDLDDETINLIALMVVKKARYGINYEEMVEDLINQLNTEIMAFYG